ncbi:hypothetical protein B0H66DRAFT_379109 [Apodospora peruviana]|uniref:Mg2+ transporter protein, CorA-like/Zinc transport protein ZntB n=1 Tax=Apodospora peruviana TaxID=516989 RepID=A0AAE0HU15_9PEZI|nr:hypothetical protein B0H66DRAFT_379109 [Apodospora peruviana]
MEGLRKQGLSALSRIIFEPAPPEHELIIIDSPTAKPSRARFPLADILAQYPEESTSALPAVRLVKLHIAHPPIDRTGEPPTLNASKDEIVQLWRCFNLDLALFDAFAQGIRGICQHYPTVSRDNTTTPEFFHFVFSSFTYCVAWAYCPRLKTTSGIVVVRREYDLGQIDFEHFCQTLEQQIATARHPLCLVLVSAMQTVDLASEASSSCQALINQVEVLSGFNPWSALSPSRRHLSRERSPAATSLTIDELSLASRNIGTILVFLEDNVRQINLLKQATESFMDASSILGMVDDAESERLEVLSALHVLRQQMDSSKIRLDYLRERGKNQFTVLFNLMTRADASASIALARSAKKDSNSMKVIAVMTMAFLPSTFIAALFAIPSLRWDSSPVVQDNFWVFWAFAVPATVMVFASWFWMSREKGSLSLWYSVMESRRRRRTRPTDEIILEDTTEMQGMSGRVRPIPMTALRNRASRFRVMDGGGGTNSGMVERV